MCVSARPHRRALRTIHDRSASGAPMCALSRHHYARSGGARPKKENQHASETNEKYMLTTLKNDDNRSLNRAKRF